MCTAPIPASTDLRATSFWSSGTGTGRLRTLPLRRPGPGEVLIQALHSGISRGSESLVYAGRVPPAVAQSMRAPFQEGEFAGPVKYGYLSVGIVVELGSDTSESTLRVGQRVFTHFPHQDYYVVPLEAAYGIPDGVPSSRAVLGGVVETAINVAWDAAPKWGDRIAIIGCGLIGASLCTLLRTFPLDRLVVVDPDPRSAPLARDLGIEWRTPEGLTGDFDTVLHCSGTQEGLALGLSLLTFEGELIEVSWFGQHCPQVPLGADFHVKRLTIRASQVSAVATCTRHRRSRQDRMRLALQELHDPFYDSLLTGRTALVDLPQTMDSIACGRLPGWCHIVDYPPCTAGVEEASCSP
ncbi:MAG: zinc-binding alcohol dehydrogenase [Ornithinimicrobium sp.]